MAKPHPVGSGDSRCPVGQSGGTGRSPHSIAANGKAARPSLLARFLARYHRKRLALAGWGYRLVFIFFFPADNLNALDGPSCRKGLIWILQSRLILLCDINSKNLYPIPAQTMWAQDESPCPLQKKKKQQKKACQNPIIA